MKESEKEVKITEEGLEKILKENQVLDDHGGVIIGSRNQKPIHPE